MTFLEKIKEVVAKSLEIDKKMFSYPPDSSLGDLSLPCFSLAKSKGQNPIDLAKKLAEELIEKEEFQKIFSKIEAAGAYLNFFIKEDYLSKEVIGEVLGSKDKYGINNDNLSNVVVIEYSNGNTHKEYHVGHLRNIVFGESVKNLLNSQGYRAVPVSYINDFGIHVAKTVWNWRLNPVYDERPESKGFLLGRCYSEASKKLSEEPELKKEVVSIMKNIESRQGEDYEFWQKSRQWSIDYFNNIYKELDVNFEETFYESEVIDRGLEIVKELIEKKVFIKGDGAIICDLNDYNLGVLPIIRSDGTALYPVADLALALKKNDKYQPKKSLHVIDIRQSLYFKQLSKVLELAGYNVAMDHLSYDFVTLPEGMMASRTGNVITYENLKEKVYTELFRETKKRHQDWPNSRLERVSKSLTISTIKFEMLKISPEKIITFNLEEAARSDGFTACYVLYGYARMKSIIRKGSSIFCFKKKDLSLLKENREKELLLKISKYPEVLKVATEKNNPSDLLKYLFELVQLFSDYYHNCNILKADKKVKLARLELVLALSKVLFNGLNILGIQALEEM